jgi:hypothetical protein
MDLFGLFARRISALIGDLHNRGSVEIYIKVLFFKEISM